MSSAPDPFETSDTDTATAIDLSTESHVTRLHRAAIGTVSADYYLPVLARLDTRDRAIPIWNWAACLSTLNWMAFRGLWGPALLYAGAVLGAVLGLLSLIRLALPMAESVQWGLWAALLTLLLLIPGFFGNAWLYGVYRRRLAQALSATASVQEACQLLDRQSSSRQRMVWIAIGNLLLAGLLLAAWSWQPARYTPPMVDGNITPAKSADPAVGASAAVVGQADSAAPAVESAPEPQTQTPISMDKEAAAAAAAPVATRSVPGLPASAGVPSDSVPREPEPRRSTRFRVVAPESPARDPAVAAVPDAEAARPAAASKGEFLINVGLFAQEDNAQRAHARLREAGLPAFTQDLQRPGGTLTRVRVGPFATRADADAAALRIRAMNLDAVVFR